MFVDTGLLHSGANESHRAGGHAQDAADHLSRGPLLSGMFGEFAAAESFHDAVTSARAHHVKTLQAHQETLTTVGANAHLAANEFTNTEERNAAKLRAVRCSSNT
jgi:uncharacterized protein DUF2563